MKIEITDISTGAKKRVEGRKAIAIAKKIVNTYIALDCFNAGIPIIYKELKFEKILDNL